MKQIYKNTIICILYNIFNNIINRVYINIINIYNKYIINNLYYRVSK